MITKVLQKIRYSQRIPCHELYGQHLQCTETSHPIRRDLLLYHNILTQKGGYYAIRVKLLQYYIYRT